MLKLFILFSCVVPFSFGRVFGGVLSPSSFLEADTNETAPVDSWKCAQTCPGISLLAPLFDTPTECGIAADSINAVEIFCTDALSGCITDCDRAKKSEYLQSFLDQTKDFGDQCTNRECKWVYQRGLKSASAREWFHWNKYSSYFQNYQQFTDPKLLNSPDFGQTLALPYSVTFV